MKSPTRALVVEDHDRWIDILSRAARRAGVSEVVRCTNIDEARAALQRTRFDIAILDIGLDPDDDTNSEGVRALELVREADGDSTRCVLVTGWQGGDRMNLQADLSERLGVEGAFMKEKYDARALIDKLGALLADAPERRMAISTPMAALAAGVVSWRFEDELLRTVAPSKGIETLYWLTAQLLGPVLPLVAATPGAPMTPMTQRSLIGIYWSRALGGAIAVELGHFERTEADEHILAEGVQNYLGLTERPEMLEKVDRRNVRGRLWELPGVPRDRFPTTPIASSHGC